MEIIKRTKIAVPLSLALSVVANLGLPRSASAEPMTRAYEMVSPLYKAGFSVAAIDAVGPDEDGTNSARIIFSSLGAFGGDPGANVISNAYVARRGELGWSSGPLSPPASAWPYGLIVDYSANVSLSLSFVKPGLNAGGVLYEGSEGEYVTLNIDLGDAIGNFEAVASPLSLLQNAKEFNLGYQLADAAFSHIVFDTAPGRDLVIQAKGTLSDLYDLSRGHLDLVGLNNHAKVLSGQCSLPAPGEFSGKGSWLNAVSADGEQVAFVVGVPGEGSSECGQHRQVFVRLGDSRTLEVSRSLNASEPFGGCLGESNKIAGEVPCTGASERAAASYEGTSEDGTRMYFTTKAPLATSDKDTGNDLYLAKIECAARGTTACAASEREVTSLTQVSQGAPAEVQGVVAISQDGARVYFVARGALTGANNAGKSPIVGADNLYVYSYSGAGGVVGFIADLCSGFGASGRVRDAVCPSGPASDSGLWEEAKREAQVNQCYSSSCEMGRFLVFASFGQLNATDTDAAKDIYRYDAKTGLLSRISGGVDGYDANGNNDLFDAKIHESSERGSVAEQHDLPTREIAEDGSRVIFTSAEPLAAAAGNGLSNAYEWHEEAGGAQNVSLLSSGNSDGPVDWAVTSPSAHDVFFLTTQGLDPADTDGQADLYDAREDGGFLLPESSIQSCSGDACQGPLTNPAPVFVPGSMSAKPGDNYAPKRVREKHRHKKHTKKRARRLRHKLSRVKQRGVSWKR